MAKASRRGESRRDFCAEGERTSGIIRRNLVTFGPGHLLSSERNVLLTVAVNNGHRYCVNDDSDV